MYWTVQESGTACTAGFLQGFRTSGMTSSPTDQEPSVSSAVIASSSNCRERIKERGERLDLTWEQLWHLCSRFGRPHLAAVAASCSLLQQKTG